jgi:hypothetical protein
VESHRAAAYVSSGDKHQMIIQMTTFWYDNKDDFDDDNGDNSPFTTIEMTP